MAGRIDASFSESYPWRTFPTSPLYNIEPVGISTPLIESFTCYTFQRLPQSHSLLPHDLYREVYMPSFLEIKPQGKLPQKISSSALSIWNGVSNSTRVCVETINKLTSRNDLDALTLLSVKSVFSQQALLR